MQSPSSHKPESIATKQLEAGPSQLMAKRQGQFVGEHKISTKRMLSQTVFVLVWTEGFFWKLQQIVCNCF